MDPEDFKSFCRALTTSEVGSIPTRSRHLRKVISHSRRIGLAIVAAAVTMVPRAGASAVTHAGAGGLLVSGDSASVKRPLQSVELGTAPEGTFSTEEEVGTQERSPEAIWAGPSPRGAALRSALYPGWGQLANRKFYKACAVFGLEAYLLGVAVLSSRRAQDLLDSSALVTSDAELAELERRHAHFVDRRNAHLWWLGAAILYSVLDAYVDASLAEVEKGLSKPPPVFLESRPGDGVAIRLGIWASF